MKLGIMQPYFLPYLGYISLIKHTDRFILLDTVQFIRHGWIERNRIIKQGESWQYISVPLQKHSRETKIKDIKIDNTVDWQKKIIDQFGHYKKKAPFYNQAMETLQKGLEIKTENLTKIVYNMLFWVCDYLKIPFECSIFSECDIHIKPVNAPDEWALNICEALGADEYWNPPGGQFFFDSQKYKAKKIKLIFQKINLPLYSQCGVSSSFEPGLSILDVMMFNSVDKINQMLDDFELL